MTIEKVRMEQVIDENGNTSVIHPETTSDNVVHMGNTMDKLVTLGGESQSNFNFIENEIVKNGLVFSRSGLNVKTFYSVAQETTDIFTIVLKEKVNDATRKDNIIPFLSTSKDSYFAINSLNYIKYFKYSSTGSDDIVFSDTCIIDPSSYNTFIITVNKIDKSISFVVNGKQPSVKVFKNIAFEKIDLGYVSSGYYSSIDFDFVGVYNRLLTPQEIAHNFNVLNNSPSLSHLATTDSTGKTTKQLFDCYSDHVEMDTGRTVQQELDAYRNIMAKEFVSDGSDITIDNAIESKIMGLTLEGQTVKNYADTYSVNNIALSGAATFDETTALITATANGGYNNCYLNYNTKILEADKRYKVIFYITKNTLNTVFQLNRPSNERAFIGIVELPIGATGVREYTLTTRSDMSTVKYSIGSYVNQESTTGEISFNAIIIDENAPTPTSYIPFGLSSTQAQLTVNGHTTKFYASEEDKANQKQILLSKVGSVVDKFEIKEDGNGTWFNANIDIKSSDGAWHLNVEQGDGYVMQQQGVATLKPSTSILCDVLPQVGITNYNTDSVGRPQYKFLKTHFNSSSECQQWLKDNPFSIKGNLATPTTTHIPKHLIDTIPVNKINTLSAGGSVRPTRFSVTVPVDKVSDMEARLQALEQFQVQQTLKV